MVKKKKHPNEQTFKNRKTVANKAGDSSDPSSIIHQLLVSCLGMWQRPHSQISVVRFCPTKSVLGETQTLERTHIQPQKLHLQRMHTHSPKVAAAAAAHMRVTGIPALWWPTGCWAARVYKQHEPWGCTSHLSVSPPHAHTPSLSNPYAILPAPKCHLIRLCDTLRASLNSIAVSLCPSLFISSVSPALRRHTV